MSEKTIYPKPPHPRRVHPERRYRVRYAQMAIEGGGSASWLGYHHTWLGARIAAWWNQRVATYGGIVTITDREVGSPDPKEEACPE